MIIDHPGKGRFIKTVLNNVISALEKTPSKTKPGTIMTRSELARLIGMKPQQLFKVLNEGNPTLGTIWQICNTLNISPQSLFEDTDLKTMKRLEPNIEKMLHERKK